MRALFARELRSALRERSVVLNSILLPVLLYPLILWIEISALMFASGLAERAPSRLAWVDPPESHPALLDSLSRTQRLEVVDSAAVLSAALERLAEGELDAVLSFEAAPAGSRDLTDNFSATVHFDRSVDRSRRARDRVERVVAAYREGWIEGEASALGLDAPTLEPFRVERENVSTDEALGASLLSTMIPLFLVIAVALGCLVPAVDATAGERERGTWETLMSTQASRGSIVVAKYLHVAAFGAVAGVLNVTAMAAALGPVMAPLQAAEDGPAFSVSISVGAALVMVAGAVVLALFFAAAMMLLASFARTFKDGQALVTPVFYLALLPLILGQQSDLTLTPAVAAVPVANVAMAVRDALQGIFLWPLLAQTFAVSGLVILACLALARWVLGFEDFLLGSHGGSLWRFARDRMKRDGAHGRRRTADAGVAGAPGPPGTGA